MLEKLSAPHVTISIVMFLLGGMIGLSFASEHMYHCKPSTLHEMYRWCAVVVLFSMALAFSFKNSPNIAQKLVSFSCIMLFWGVIITAYHILIQRGIMPESSICKIKFQVPQNISMKEFSDFLQMQKEASCSRMELQIFKHPISEFFCVTFMFLFTYISTSFQKRR